MEGWKCLLGSPIDDLVAELPRRAVWHLANQAWEFFLDGAYLIAITLALLAMAQVLVDVALSADLSWLSKIGTSFWHG